MAVNLARPPFHPRLFESIQTDFLITSAGYHSPWSGVAINSGTISAGAALLNHPGWHLIRSSTTANSGYRWLTDGAGLSLAGGESTTFIFASPTAINSNTTIYMGFTDGLTAAPVDGVYLQLSGTTLTGRTRSNSTESITTSNYTIASNTWYRAQIMLNADATRVDFALYSESGEQLWSDYLTTNIPTGAGRETGHGVVAVNSGTTAVDLLKLDYMNLSIQRRLVR